MNSVELRQILTNHYNIGEIRLLCFDLDVDYELLSGDTKGEKIIELIKYCDRHGKRDELVTAIRLVYLNTGKVSDKGKRLHFYMKNSPVTIIVSIVIPFVLLFSSSNLPIPIRQVFANISEDNYESPVAIFTPLDNKESLVRSFAVIGDGERVALRFIARNFDLDFEFTTPLEKSCYTLLNDIERHFSLKEHIDIQPDAFPTVWKGTASWPNLVLTLNGVNCDKESLGELSVKNGDEVRLEMEWVMTIHVSGEKLEPVVPCGAYNLHQMCEK